MEIKQMEDEEIIGFHRKLPPFKAKRMDWRNSKLLKQRQQTPAPEILPLPKSEDISQRLIWTRERKLADGYIDPDEIEG